MGHRVLRRGHKTCDREHEKEPERDKAASSAQEGAAPEPEPAHWADALLPSSEVRFYAEPGLACGALDHTREMGGTAGAGEECSKPVLGCVGLDSLAIGAVREDGD